MRVIQLQVKFNEVAGCRTRSRKRLQVARALIVAGTHANRGSDGPSSCISVTPTAEVLWWAQKVASLSACSDLARTTQHWGSAIEPHLGQWPANDHRIELVQQRAWQRGVQMER